MARISAASVTGMAKRLAKAGLVRRAPYRGLTLTEEGRKAALGVVRRHRLVELYLAEVLRLRASQSLARVWSASGRKTEPRPAHHAQLPSRFGHPVLPKFSVTNYENDDGYEYGLTKEVHCSFRLLGCSTLGLAVIHNPPRTGTGATGPCPLPQDGLGRLRARPRSYLSALEEIERS